MTPGRFKFIADRLKNYLSWPSTFMIVDLWLDKVGVSWLYAAPVIILASCVVWLLDKRHVLPEENRTGAEVNPFLTDLRKDIKTILGKL